MKQIILIATAAFLGSAVAAIAAQQTDGVVQNIDTATGTLELQSGQSFTFKNGSLLYGLLPGDRVGVSHDGSAGIDTYDPHPTNAHDID